MNRSSYDAGNSDNSSTVEIPFNRRVLVERLIFMIVSTALITGGTWIAPAMLRVARPLTVSSVESLVAGVVWMAFGAKLALLLASSVLELSRNLCTNQPAIVVDANGITDNASWEMVGFIPWGSIASVDQTLSGNLKITFAAGSNFVSTLSLMRRLRLGIITTHICVAGSQLGRSADDVVECSRPYLENPATSVGL